MSSLSGRSSEPAFGVRGVKTPKTIPISGLMSDLSAGSAAITGALADQTIA